MHRTTTQKTAKRNLSSSSSINLDTSLKKSKTFVSPNRFSALSVDDETPEVFSPPPVTGSITPQLEHNASPSNNVDDIIIGNANKPSPPIVISNVTNYPTLKAALTSLVGTDGFTTTAKGTALIVKPRNCADYHKLVQYCNNSDLECHTWEPRYTRPFKVLIRNLHHTSPVEDIDYTLQDLGFSVINVSNVRHHISKKALSLFTVVLEANEFDRSIYKYSYLLNSKIKIEKTHQARYLPLCKQCQRYDHTQAYCSQTSRCVKCGNNHLTRDCVKSSEQPAKCVLCSDAHTANYKGCPSLKKKSIPSYKKDILKITPPGLPIAPSRVLPVTVEPPSTHIRHKGNCSAKTYAEATLGNSNNLNNESISNIFLQFVTQLNSLITPLISLLSTLLNALLSKNTLSP